MAGGDFSTVLLPGLMAVAIMFSGIAAVALPLAQEFGITREIDDRVMCPLPVAAVAIEKICFCAVQSMIAAALSFRWRTMFRRRRCRACQQLAVSHRGCCACQPDCRGAGADDRHERASRSRSA